MINFDELLNNKQYIESKILAKITNGEHKGIDIHLLSVEEVTYYIQRSADVDDDEKIDVMADLIAKSIDIGKQTVLSRFPMSLLTELGTEIIKANTDLSSFTELEDEPIPPND